MVGITDRRIAVLATDGVEQAELTEPVKVLKDAGAAVDVIAPEGTQIQAWNGDEKGDLLAVDTTLDQARSTMYDALLLPGGFRNASTLRMNPAAKLFVHRFVLAGKPIAAISHAPWILIEVEVVQARLMTSWPSLRTDLTNAGALWHDRPVMVDSPVVTGRVTADLPDFCREMLKMFDDPVAALLEEQERSERLAEERAAAERAKAERLAAQRETEQERRIGLIRGVSANPSSARRLSPLPRPPARP